MLYSDLLIVCLLPLPFAIKCDMSRKTKNLTVHEALELLEELNVDNCSDLDPAWSSDEDDETSRNPYIVILPPDEKPDAVTDEDSDFDETGDPDRPPRRVLVEEPLFSSTH